MTGERGEEIGNGWTVNTLRRYITDRMDERDRRYGERFEAQERAVSAALASAKEAVSKAEIATERRLETLNELRQMNTDMATSLMPKVEAEIRLSALGKEIDSLRSSRDVGVGRFAGKERVTTDNRWLYGAVVSAISITLSLAVLVVLVVTR
jgi:hypothetical protein